MQKPYPWEELGAGSGPAWGVRTGMLLMIYASPLTKSPLCQVDFLFHL